MARLWNKWWQSENFKIIQSALKLFNYLNQKKNHHHEYYKFP